MESTFLLSLAVCFLSGCLVGVLLISVVMVKFQETDFAKEMGAVNRKLHYMSTREDVLLDVVKETRRDFSLLRANLQAADSIVIFKTPEPERVGLLGEHQVPEEG